MAKDIYTVTIKVEKIDSYGTKYKTLKDIKLDYEIRGWKSLYHRKNGERYLMVENPSNGEKRIFSYDSTMGDK